MAPVWVVTVADDKLRSDQFKNAEDACAKIDAARGWIKIIDETRGGFGKHHDLLADFGHRLRKGRMTGAHTGAQFG